MVETTSLELAEIAASTGPVRGRAQDMLGSLRRLVPFDAAWLALADPMSSSYTTLASTDLAESTLQDRSCIDDGQLLVSFLWPRRGRHAPDGHVRVTVLTSPGDAPAALLGAVILPAVSDPRGLTSRELEVLGLGRRRTGAAARRDDRGRHELVAGARPRGRRHDP